jgi:hypothetical protein
MKYKILLPEQEINRQSSFYNESTHNVRADIKNQRRAAIFQLQKGTRDRHLSSHTQGRVPLTCHARTAF